MNNNVPGGHLQRIRGLDIGPAREHVSTLGVGVDELAVALDGRAGVDGLQGEDEHLVPRLHGRHEHGEQRVAQQQAVQLGHLAAQSRVGQHALDGFHHAVDVGALFEEAELAGERHLAHDVEGKILQPRAEVDGPSLGGEAVEPVHEQPDARVDGLLGLEEVGQAVRRADLALLDAVVVGVARREQVHLRPLLPRDALDRVEGRLCVVFLDVVDDRDVRRVRQRHVVGPDANHRSVLAMQLNRRQVRVPSPDIVQSPEFGVCRERWAWDARQPPIFVPQKPQHDEDHQELEGVRQSHVLDSRENQAQRAVCQGSWRHVVITSLRVNRPVQKFCSSKARIIQHESTFILFAVGRTKEQDFLSSPQWHSASERDPPSLEFAFAKLDDSWSIISNVDSRMAVTWPTGGKWRSMY